MAGVELEINELPLGALQADNILHSKDSSGADIQGRVQDIVNLIPNTDVENYQPPLSLVVSSGSDSVVFSDASDSGVMKRVSISTFISSLGLLKVSGSITNGYYNLGEFQVRWGTVLSDSDGILNFSFQVPFTTECFGVWANRDNLGSSYPELVGGISPTGFILNRNDAVSGTSNVQYLAIGR